jgi:hypothetical protein
VTLGPQAKNIFLNTIDELKIKGALMFRLAECITAIVIHDSVKRTIESAGIDTLEFVSPDKWVI